MGEDEAKAQAKIFKALADSNRLRILSIIAADENEETCVCDLSDPVGLGQPTVSHHLKILVEAGLLQREKRGVWAYFSIDPQGFKQAQTLLQGFSQMELEEDR